MNELTIEVQRVLTEALGECRHEKRKEIKLKYGVPVEKEYCSLCNEIDPQDVDFNDGRVTMRLTEYVIQQGERGISVIMNSFGEYEAHVLSGDMYGGYSSEGVGSTKEIAIAKAVYAHIMAKGK